MSFLAMLFAFGLEKCDNDAFSTINMMSTYALIAFFLHALGATLSLFFLAEEERYYFVYRLCFLKYVKIYIFFL